MAFLVQVACDLGGEKLNYGIEFDTKPTVGELTKAVEALYTPSMRRLRNDSNTKFRCVSLMVARDDAWEEVVSGEQISAGAQFFAFDWTSTGASDGPMPPVLAVVKPEQFLNDSQLASTPRGAISHAAPTAPLNMPYKPPEYDVDPPVVTPEPSTTAGGGGSRSRSSYQHASTSKLPPQAREYLFTQLSRGARAGNENGISTHRLHAIFVDYGLTFSTETFSDMTYGKRTLSRAEWTGFEDEYGPVVDALYDRIATRSKMLREKDSPSGVAPRTVDEIREDMLHNELEEARLMAEQARLRKRAAELQRELRDSEAWLASSKKNSSLVEDRSREWDTLQKFVALRRKQAQLRRDELQVTHELSLL